MENAVSPAVAIFEISISALTFTAAACLVIWIVTLLTKNMTGWTEGWIAVILLTIGAALRHLTVIQPEGGITPFYITLLSVVTIAVGGFHAGNFIKTVILKR